MEFARTNLREAPDPATLLHGRTEPGTSQSETIALDPAVVDVDVVKRLSNAGELERSLELCGTGTECENRIS